MSKIRHCFVKREERGERRGREGSEVSNRCSESRCTDKVLYS